MSWLQMMGVIAAVALYLVLGFGISSEEHLGSKTKYPRGWRRPAWHHPFITFLIWPLYPIFLSKVIKRRLIEARAENQKQSIKCPKCGTLAPLEETDIQKTCQKRHCEFCNEIFDSPNAKPTEKRNKE